MPFSQSEHNGLALLTGKDLLVFAPGVSTGGMAEIEMARSQPGRSVIATTLDQAGLTHAQTLISEVGMASQVSVKLEDLSQPHPYADAYFDFTYARLVLHYLDYAQLDYALGELHRTLKPGHLLYAVVRSVNCPETSWPSSTYDPASHLTTFIPPAIGHEEPKALRRYFHTETSFVEHLIKAGFTIQSIHSHDEQIYRDFRRTIPSTTMANLIEVVAVA